jgi:hypothetical protein
MSKGRHHDEWQFFRPMIKRLPLDTAIEFLNSTNPWHRERNGRISLGCEWYTEMLEQRPLTLGAAFAISKAIGISESKVVRNLTWLLTWDRRRRLPIHPPRERLG